MAARVLALSWLCLAMGCTYEGSTEPRPRRAAHVSELHFAGDVYFGESYPSGPHSRDARYRLALARLRPVFESAPTIANLESTFAAPEDPGRVPNKSYLHWSDAEATAAALSSAGFTALSLANNHAMDFGLGALGATQSALARHGIATFGAGSSLAAAREPLRLTLHPGDQVVHVAVLGAYWQRPRYADQYRFYASEERGGVRELAPDDITAQIGALDAAQPSQHVVVFPHWGRNYRWRNREQRRVARRLVAAGADLVIGHGAHNFQEVEREGGRWVFYGVGNLVFLSPGRYGESDVPPFSLLVTLKWHARGAEPPAHLLVRFITSDNTQTDYQPRLATGAAFAAGLAALERRSCRERNDFCDHAVLGEDELGPHVRLPFHPR